MLWLRGEHPLQAWERLGHKDKPQDRLGAVQSVLGILTQHSGNRGIKYKVKED